MALREILKQQKKLSFSGKEQKVNIYIYHNCRFRESKYIYILILLCIILYISQKVFETLLKEEGEGDQEPGFRTPPRRPPTVTRKKKDKISNNFIVPTKEKRSNAATAAPAATNDDLVLLLLFI